MSALYDKGREAFAIKQINWVADTIKAVLIDTGAYTVNLATHQFLSDIPGGARVATSGALQNKTAPAGVCDADDITVSGVPNISVESLALFLDTGNAATSPLIAYIDNMTGMPFQTSNGDVALLWDNGANKIFKL